MNKLLARFCDGYVQYSQDLEKRISKSGPHVKTSTTKLQTLARVCTGCVCLCVSSSSSSSSQSPSWIVGVGAALSLNPTYIVDDSTSTRATSPAGKLAVTFYSAGNGQESLFFEDAQEFWKCLTPYSSERERETEKESRTWRLCKSIF